MKALEVGLKTGCAVFKQKEGTKGRRKRKARIVFKPVGTDYTPQRCIEFIPQLKSHKKTC